MQLSYIIQYICFPNFFLIYYICTIYYIHTNLNLNKGEGVVRRALGTQYLGSTISPLVPFTHILLTYSTLIQYLLLAVLYLLSLLLYILTHLHLHHPSTNLSKCCLLLACLLSLCCLCSALLLFLSFTCIAIISLRSFSHLTL